MATINLGRVGFVNKGAHNIATAYKVNDVVTYNGGTYACVQAHTGQLPTATAYWQNWVANDKALDSAVVHKTGDETIAGVKTFSSSPIVPNATTGTQAIAYGQAVKNTGDETIAGVKTFTDGVKVQNQNVSPFSGFKNYIINGNFDVWQYGTSQTASTYGSDDRWANYHNGSTKTHLQVACTDTERALFNASFFSRTVVTSVAGVNNFVLKEQRIENIHKLAGKTVTLSFWAKADSNKKLGISSEVHYGTGGSPSSELDKAGIQQILDLTAVWKKFTITVALPTAVGKTLGTDGVHTSDNQITFWFDAGSAFASAYIPGMIQQSGTFDIAQVQLEEGSVATPFENRPYGLELSLCQRYYQAGGGYVTVFSGNVTNGVYYSNKIYLPVAMRTTPTAVLTDAGGNSNFQATVGNVYSNTTCIREDRVASGTGIGTFQSTFTASAEL